MAPAVGTVAERTFQGQVRGRASDCLGAADGPPGGRVLSMTSSKNHRPSFTYKFLPGLWKKCVRYKMSEIKN